METWMWISLYTVQTLVGVVLWRRFDKTRTSTLELLAMSCVVFMNIVGLIFILAWGVIYLIKQLCKFIDFLAGIKNKETEGIKCTGNNGNGCFMDSCGHNCGCQGIGGKK